MNEKIAIIGGTGNMGRAIAQGLETRQGGAEQLILTSSATHNNVEATAVSDVVILSVKPQKMRSVLQEIGTSAKGKLIISVAAGVTMESIRQTLSTDDEQRIVRVMPNLGARVGESMSVWVANEFVTDADKVVVRDILASVGKEVEIEDEDMIDAVTAISGSGPAYFFYFVEQLAAMGQEFGFSEEIARMLAEQTLIGAAHVLANSDQTAKELRLAVTSEGGTTYAAIKRFGREKIPTRFQRGVSDARRRAGQLRI